MKELKPCPFCGKTPKIEEWQSDVGKYYFVQCREPKCRIQPSTSGHVARNVVSREWNRRVKE